ncbi:TPA_asm: molecular chaperone DnaJ [Salmonella enterica subsp. enterica serovar Typhi str. CT18]|nr:molecular chaperone DnaJ [Salmonella enterica subsp. enterica serovar Typhi str. CT18]
MNKIIKRLEIIKSAIELEDEEIIRQQLIYLKNEPQDAVISAIAQAIETRRFSDAMQEIAAWLQAQRALSTWQDPSIAASKLELKALEAQLRDLIDKRNARVQILDDFNDLYHLRLGPLMSRILELRKQLAVSMQRKQEAEIKRREKDYQSCLQFISQAVDQLATLKQQWTGLNAASREAVGIRQRIQQQTELITALLAAIRALLTQLQSGLEPMMASDRLNNLEHLRHKIRQLRTQIDALLKEITQLETENAWRLASSVANKEAYFSEQERALTEIRNTLEAQVQQVEQELLAG